MQRAAVAIISALVILPSVACEGDGRPPQASLSTAGTATTTSREPSFVTVGSSIDSIQLVTETAGWVVMDQRLAWSDDAGDSWRDITPPALNPRGVSGCWGGVQQVFFINDSTGWVASVRPGPEGLESPGEILVFRTEDAGGSWAQSVIEGSPVPTDYCGPPSLGIINIDFVDPRRGWLAAQASGGMLAVGTLFATSDGGATWSRLPGGFQGFTGAARQVHFSNADEGFWLIDAGAPLASRDGGKSWQEVSLPAPSGYTSALPQMNQGGAAFDNAGNGALFATPFRENESMAAGFYVTHDGGGTWAFASLTPTVGALAAAGTDAWLVADSSDLYRTEDAGLTWQLVDADWSALDPLAGTDDSVFLYPRDLSFVSPKTGWAILSSEHHSGRLSSGKYKDTKTADVLIATADGGRTWTRLKP